MSLSNFKSAAFGNGVSPGKSVAKSKVDGRYVATLTPFNNQWIAVGDSRTSRGTETTSIVETNRMTAAGYQAWAQHGSNYRGKCIGNYGVNAQNLTDIQRRLTAVETRGQILASTASVVVFLAGVNDTNSAITTTGPLYDSIINQLVAAGKIVLVLNEIPNSDQGPGQGVFNRGRRDYLNAAPYDADFVTKLDSYTLMAVSANSDLFKTGYITLPDLLHPNLNGNRVLGLSGIGPLLETLFINAGFPVRNVLSTGAGDVNFAANMPFTGTTGGVGAGVTGLIADAWNSDATLPGMTVAASITTDPSGKAQQTLTIAGKTMTSGVTVPVTNTSGLAAAPVQSAATTAITGGTGLAAATTYFYKITAVSATGETLGSNEVIILTGAGTTNSNALSWSTVAGATGYKVYRGTAAGAENVSFLLGTVLSYVDTGIPVVGSTAIQPFALVSYLGGLGLSNDVLEHSCRLIVDAGNVGLTGVGVILSTGDNTNGVYQNSAQLSGSVFDPQAHLGGAWNGVAFDGNVVGQPLTLGVGWTASVSKSVNATVEAHFLPGRAYSAVIRYSSSGLMKNK